MKLGWWRDRQGAEIMVSDFDQARTYKWGASSGFSRWNDDGKSCWGNSDDLIEFIRPLEDIPPTLNSAVKAAEDRVREFKQLVDETQTAWATACRLHEAARKELERLEKECEVKS